MKNERKIVTAPLLGAVVNALLATVKIAGGVVGHSGALIADGLESCADVVSSLVVWGGLRVSFRPPDDDHPYGHGKAEPLAAAATSVVLLAAAAVIAVESIKQILIPHQTPRWYTLIILAVVVGVKGFLSRFVLHAGDGIESSALKSDALHHLSDALTSLAAFVGISIALIGGPGYESADDWAALVACCIISYTGVRLLTGAVNEVMDAAPSPDYVKKIRTVARRVDGVIDIEKCRIRKSGLHHLIDIHVEVNGDLTVREGHEIAHRVKDALLESEHHVLDVLVHIEPCRDEPTARAAR